MSLWNYRVMVKDGSYAVHEVFYDDEGNVEAWAEDPVYPRGQSVEELAEDFDLYRLALDKPPLDYQALQAEAASRRVDEGPAA